MIIVDEWRRVTIVTVAFLFTDVARCNILSDNKYDVLNPHRQFFTLQTQLFDYISS